MTEPTQRIGDIDLRDVITDREPPVRVAPHGPLLDPPPVPTLTTEDVRIRLRTWQHRESTEELLPDFEGMPDDGSLEPPVVRQVRPRPKSALSPSSWLPLIVAAGLLALAAALWWL